MVEIDHTACIGCSYCFEICPSESIKIIKGKATVMSGCVNCYTCIGYCPVSAIRRE